MAEESPLLENVSFVVTEYAPFPQEADLLSNPNKRWRAYCPEFGNDSWRTIAEGTSAEQVLERSKQLLLRWLQHCKVTKVSVLRFDTKPLETAPKRAKRTRKAKNVK